MKSPASKLLWLIVKQETGRMDVLTASLAGGEKALPVFSFEEEADMFLEFEAPGDGWWVRETMIGELTSVLFGPCAGVSRVLLDPLPGREGRALTNLASMGQEAFLEFHLNRQQLHALIGRNGTPHPQDAGSGPERRLPVGEGATALQTALARLPDEMEPGGPIRARFGGEGRRYSERSLTSGTLQPHASTGGFGR